jgi:TolA-binding protein
VLPANQNQTPETSRLSPQASGALSGLAAAKPPATTVPAKSAMILPEDLETAAGGGEEYLLGSIARGSFTNKDWTSAAAELNRFLALPRGKNAEARARFYLGQCLYFTNNPRAALFEFLAARPMYPNQTGQWIQTILSLLTD